MQGDDCILGGQQLSWGIGSVLSANPVLQVAKDLEIKMHTLGMVVRKGEVAIGWSAGHPQNWPEQLYTFHYLVDVRAGSEDRVWVQRI
jgi:hypothetical protein